MPSALPTSNSARWPAILLRLHFCQRKRKFNSWTDLTRYLLSPSSFNLYSSWGLDMPQHIGIVACSAEGAALCYRTICIEGADLMGPHAHPEVSIHTHCLADYMRHIRADDWKGVAELMLSSADKLSKMGADF